jgi:hypothetical protein
MPRRRGGRKLCVVTAEPTQLLLYRFSASAAFEGHLVGALERLEAGGALRVLDVIVVGRDAETAETLAVDLRGGGAGGIVAALVGFRLDAGERRRATRRALARPGGRGELVRRLAATLAPGEAVAALLIAHAWARALGEAVVRTDGTELANTMVAPATLVELAPELLAAAGQRA